MLTAAALFAIGVAFAAQTTLRADWGENASGQQSPWVPGTNALMSAQERDISVMPPPR
ncbi:MAG: hypothetical protein WBF89_11075 [Steroidobacteraceae bacterium]